MMSSSSRVNSLEIFAPAKINLFLHVTGKRDDGYHLLDSLVVFANVGDTLRIVPADGLSLKLEGPAAGSLQAESNNIVLRAAHALAGWAGIVPQAAITLIKRLPVSSGIGGGSTDGAATLRGLIKLWNITIGEDELMRLGLTLGADVPVCLRACSTRVTGIGEILEDVPPLPTVWLVLVNPGVAVSTPAVFKRRTGIFSPSAPFGHVPVDVDDLAHMLSHRHNDLMPPAITLAPVIDDVLAALAECPGCMLARMSGSGATCFGLFPDQAGAEQAAQAIARPAWWIAPAALL